MRLTARLLLSVLLAWLAIPAYPQTSPQLIVTTPGSADDLPQGAAKLNADITALWNAVFNGTGGTGGTGGGGYANVMDLCSYPGVDSTGVTGSTAAVQAAANAAVAAGNTTIQVGCPIFLHFDQGATGAAEEIFLQTGTHFKFLPSGKFIVDNMGVNVFDITHATDVLFQDANIEYEAAFGANAISSGFGAFASAWPTAYEVTLQNYLHSNFNITFPGGVNPVNNTSAFMAIFNIRGASDVTFRNLHVYVPTGASPANFIPEVFYLWPEFNPNTTAVTSSAANATNSSIPKVTIDHAVLDGTLMSMVGIADLHLNDVLSLRYSDLQDGTNGTISFSASFASGASSATLAAPWALPTGIYCPTLSNAQIVCMTLQFGLTSATNFINASSGAATTVSSAATATATSGNVGGISTWFAPPHLIYVWSQDGTFANNGWPYRIIAHNIQDLGPYVGLSTRRSTGSGTALSLKPELSGGSIIDGYISLRPDGFLDLESGNSGGGVMRNVYAVYNSTTATANSGIPWGFRTPLSGAYTDLDFANVTMIDSAAEPAGPCYSTLFNGFSTDITMTNMKCYLNDWPLTATWYPGFQFVGNHINFQGELHFAAMSSTSTFRPPLDEQGGNAFTNSNVDLTLFGWRQLPVTFSAALASGATAASLSATAYPTGWPYQSGTYKATLPSGEQRYIPFTNGSLSLGSFVALSSAEPAAGSIAGNALVNNYNGYSARAVFSQVGAGYGNYVRIHDVDNEWTVTAKGLVSNEEWTQEQVIQGSAFTGTSYTTQIVFPTTFSCDETGWMVSSTFTGATAIFQFGFGGGSGLLNNANVSTSNVGYAPTGSLASTGSAVVVTSNAGTPTAGTGVLAVHCNSMLGTH